MHSDCRRAAGWTFSELAWGTAVCPAWLHPPCTALLSALPTHCALHSVLCGPLLQTGAGKTYTMSGEAQQYARRGIVPRALHQLFQEVELRVDRSYDVKVSFLEIHNEVGQPYCCSV